MWLLSIISPFQSQGIAVLLPLGFPCDSILNPKLARHLSQGVIWFSSPEPLFSTHGLSLLQPGKPPLPLPTIYSQRG